MALNHLCLNNMKEFTQLEMRVTDVDLYINININVSQFKLCQSVLCVIIIVTITEHLALPKVEYPTARFNNISQK